MTPAESRRLQEIVDANVAPYKPSIDEPLLAEGYIEMYNSWMVWPSVPLLVLTGRMEI